MTPEERFTERRRPDWEELERLARSPTKPEDAARLVSLYRDVCADLARAEAARYSAALVLWLAGLTRDAHAAVYGARARRFRASARDVLLAFPRSLRARWRALALAGALFFVPFALSFLASAADPAFALRVLPESQLRPLADAYTRGFAGGREAGAGAMMTGFYVANNVGIALRCFATGIFFGLGSAFFLVYNGVVIGAMTGYIVAQGAGPNLLAFVAGHTPFELGAIVIAGGGGLSLGWSLVAPGELTRLASLRRASRDVVVIALGAAVMLFIAAGIEGFWSGSSVPSPVKLAVGAINTIAVAFYLSLAGRKWT